MKITRVEVMPLGTNCYLAYDETTGEGIVIDPGGSPELIKKAIDRDDVKVVAIINTHGHWDHIGANTEIKEYTGAPLYIHQADKPYLTDPALNISNMMGTRSVSVDADGILQEGDTVHFGNCTLQVIHTPGHTPGGICLYGEQTLFSGDTLFYCSVGRSDLPGGSYSALVQGIKDKLMVLPDATKVCPGHGILTDIGNEKSNNPFVR